MESIKSKLKYILPVGVILISLCVFMPRTQGIFFPQDEFGYWNNAAKKCGIDWSSVSKGQDSYAWGYSLLLVPIMKILDDPVLMYRIAILINGVLAVADCVLILKLVDRLFEGGSLTEGHGSIRHVAGLVCCAYPASLLYMHYTTAEVLLNVLFMLMCHLMLRISKQGMDLKTGTAGVICTACLFVTHHRTAGVAAAFLLSCITVAVISGRRKQIMATILVSVLLLVSAIVFMPRVTELSVGSLIQVLLGMSGRLLYIESASFGMALIGLAVCAGKRQEALYGFISYSFAYTAMISCLFFIDGQRLDQLVYGRYLEMFMPVLIAIGLKEIITDKSKNHLSMILATGLIAAVLTVYANKMGYFEYLPNFVSGTDWVFLGKMPDTMSVYLKPYLISLVGYLIIMLVSKNRQWISTFLGFTGIVFLCATLFLTEAHIYRFQDMDRSDRMLEAKIEEIHAKGEDWYFLDSPYMNYINIVQFWMYDKPVKLITEEVYDKLDYPIVLTYATYDRPDKLKNYDHKENSSHFILYYNGYK